MVRYVETLDRQASVRYADKLRSMCNLDLYKLQHGDWIADPKVLPSVAYINLFNGLIFHPNLFCELKDFQMIKG